MAYTTINKPTDYFNTVLYQSNNGSAQSITGVNFQPDFLWVKDRTAGGGHVLVDAVRGSTKMLGSNSTSAEVTRADQVTSFDSNGFSLGADSGGFINYSTNNNVSWNWKANGQGSSNTDGSINTTYTSASTTSGFSISTYTGTGANATVGHGLGVVPKMIIVKRLDVTSSWRIYHASLGNTKNIVLNTTAAEATSSTMWNNTSPTSTTFSLGSYDEVNGSSAPHVAYCFAEKQGFSKFGSYTGNGNADGTFVYTGFTPSFFMIKEVETTGDWHIFFNNIATQQNPIKGILYPNLTGADSDSLSVDFLANGVKHRTSGGGQNESGKTYIYMAFAEEPLVTSTGIPATAR